MKHYATCPLDCPGACALEVETNGDQVVSIRGRKEHPFTRGVICEKVSKYHEIQHGHRVLEPALRTGPKGSGQFRSVSWDEALSHVAKRLTTTVNDHGPQSVLPYYYGGTMGLVQQKAIERLSHKAGYSRQDGTLCFAIADAGWRAGVGGVFGPAPQEVAHSDLVVLWGINAISTHINFMTFVKEARKNGAKVIAIDPYRTRTARWADEHINLKPGTDAAFACAVMHELMKNGWHDRDYLDKFTDFDSDFETHLAERSPEWAEKICGIDAAVIKGFASQYGQAKRSFIRVGIGMTRQRNGAVNTHAVSCLPSITGAWQYRGGGALLGTDDTFKLQATIDVESVRRTKWQDATTRILDMSRLGSHLTDKALAPQIHALLVFNANPAGSAPNLSAVHEGLKRENLFTVVHEQVMSDTARFADILLPATTFLEHGDLYKSYGQCTIQYAKPALAPRGQARCNHEVVNALAKKLGYDDPEFQMSVDETIGEVLRASDLSGLRDTPETPWLDLSPDEDTGHFRGGFLHDDKKFHFYPDWSDDEMPKMPDHWAINMRDDVEIAKAYPLDFMTPPAHHVLNTTFTLTDRAERRMGKPVLWIHPRDAAARALVDGDSVEVFNELACIPMNARVTDDVRRGLCLCESNYAGSKLDGGLSINALSHDHAVAPSGGASFHDNRVEVRKTKIDG